MVSFTVVYNQENNGFIYRGIHTTELTMHIPMHL